MRTLDLTLLVLTLAGCGLDVPPRPAPAAGTQVLVAVVDRSGAPVQGAEVRSSINKNHRCGSSTLQYGPLFRWEDSSQLSPADGRVMVASREPVPWIEVTARGVTTRFEHPLSQTLVVTVPPLAAP
jgi:hypothetical protein